LIGQIRQRDPESQFVGLGGDLMSSAECRLYQNYRQMAFMGFVSVLRNWRQVRANFRIAREALIAEQPDVLILIDYPSFNLRMAAFCRQQLPNTKIYYYIPPKVWAWKRRRIHRIAQLCDEVLGIFPFEPAFYARYGYRCTYVGNPTAEEISHQPSAISHQPVIAILPGSRRNEISHCLPKMLEAARRFPSYRIIVCAAPGIEDAFYRPYLRAEETLTRDTYKVVQNASAAIVNSGTATLETALLRCPQTAVYHLFGERWIGLIRWAQPLFFSIPYFTLVNIIAGKEVIKECIANDFTTDQVAAELDRLLHDETYKKDMLAEYEHIRSTLGSSPAASKAAEIITTRNR
jgi:lipid-A-disaccharide synthase